jgi:PAS domain S-box-containing protein
MAASRLGAFGMSDKKSDTSDIKEHLDAIVENLPNMIFVKDAKDLRFALFNRAGENLIGHPRADMLGKNDYDFFPKKQADFFTKNDREVLASGKALDIPEEPIETPNGQRWLHTKKVPLVDSQGEPRYLLGISEDITDKRELERLKGELIAVASHELRSPAAAIQGTLEVLEDMLGKSADPEIRDMIALTKDNCERMFTLIGNCLEIEGLEGSAEQFKGVEMDLFECAAAAVKLNGPYAARYDVTLRLEKAGAALRVRTDRDRLIQALTNLLTNAAKFSPKGGEVVITLATGDRGHSIAVHDSGPGIPEEFRSRIFGKFARARTEEAAEREGSGLGLRITRRLVERLGGALSFESSPQGGTTFRIELPTAT